MDKIPFFKVFRCFRLLAISSTIDIFLAFSILLYKGKIYNFYRFFRPFPKLEKVGSSTRLVLMLIIFSFSILSSFRILSKKIDDRITLYRPNYLLIMIFFTDTVGDLFLIIIVSSLFLNTKKGSISYLAFTSSDYFSF